MATRLEQVILRGEFRKQAVQVVFTHRDNGDWFMRIDTAEADREETFNARSGVKPCWAVACRYLDKMIPPQQRKPAAVTLPRFEERRAVEVAKLREAGHVVQFQKQGE